MLKNVETQKKIMEFLESIKRDMSGVSGVHKKGGIYPEFSESIKKALFDYLTMLAGDYIPSFPRP
ncbi:hypothetical protein ES703_04015 [subsurface metagenome]